MSDSWRKFEQLVTQIEKQLVPRGAIVKSPDRIEDKITGKMREVDASIRYQIGSVPVLITIECRERSRVQDDTWIEQLASKKQKIGASHTIAVSSSGFTEPAIISAQHFEIELRRIDDITDSEIAAWIREIEIQRIRTFDSIKDWKITIEDEEGVTFSEALMKAARENPHQSKLIFQVKDDQGVSISDLVYSFFRWQAEGRLNQESYVGLADGDDFIRRKIVIKFKPNIFYTFTENGKVDVHEVEVVLGTKIESEPIMPSKVFRYSNLEKEISQIAVGNFSIGPDGEEIQFFVQPVENTEEISSSNDLIN